MGRNLFFLSSGICLIIFLIGGYFPSYGQSNKTEQCGIIAYQEYLKNQKKFALEPKESFEYWVRDKLQQKKNNPYQTYAQAQTIYRIPVVVHVVHNGESVGSGTNIPFSQIEEQIKILNQDYRRNNPDTVNTMGQFRDEAADTEIEFVLAKQDPEGLPTNGVVRVEGSRDSWRISNNSELKDQSYWPAEEYLNIWVAPLENDVLGYAQFPVSNKLDGLEDASNNRLTDGVVIETTYFGKGGNASPKSYGRTTTHEIGHFLGLRHIWGDGDCNKDDYVDDTPLQDSPTEGCPDTRSSCQSVDMFQNYLDYTDDVCMNIFTTGQKERMRIVLENSPRRESLLNSPGLTAPPEVDNDMGIREIISPKAGECQGNITPVIQVRNYGKNEVQQFKVNFLLQGNRVEEKLVTQTLQPKDTTTIFFSQISLQPNASSNDPYYQAGFEITSVNDTTDQNPNNNLRQKRFIIPLQGDFPVAQNFNKADKPILENGLLQNPDNQTTWALTEAPGNGVDNIAAYMNFYEYEQNFNEADVILSPVYDFSDVKDAKLKFKVAHATLTDGSNDGLEISVSTDCGANFNRDDILYNKFGANLATSQPTNFPFLPESRFDWRQETIDLSQYAGQENVQIAITAVNAFGNNLYLDDIRLEIQQTKNYDLAISKAVTPGKIICNTSFKPALEVKNKGINPINSFRATYQMSDGTQGELNYQGNTIPSGASRIIEFDAIDMANGEYNFQARLSLTGTNPDELEENNQVGFDFKINQSKEPIPLLQSFKEASMSGSGSLQTITRSGEFSNSGDWFITNPDRNFSWELVETKEESPQGLKNKALVMPHYLYPEIGAINKFVSPDLDFSQTFNAGLNFKVSYASIVNYTDTLNILVSTDCGNNYQEVKSIALDTVAFTKTEQPWVPSNKNQWEEIFIDLSQYAGEANVRVAFESVNGYGNNLFLDDIEFFLSGGKPGIVVEQQYKIYPNPTSGEINVSFDLEKKEKVLMQIFNTKGQLIWENQLPNTLNQIQSVDFSAQIPGIYFVRLRSESINKTSRVIVQ